MAKGYWVAYRDGVVKAFGVPRYGDRAGLVALGVVGHPYVAAQYRLDAAFAGGPIELDQAEQVGRADGILSVLIAQNLLAAAVVRCAVGAGGLVGRVNRRGHAVGLNVNAPRPAFARGVEHGGGEVYTA